MVAPSGPPRNAFVRVARTIYNDIGFSPGYNFVLLVVFEGAFLGFTLARLQHLSFNGPLSNGGAAPGECYWYTRFLKYQVGITLHLSGILPVARLASFSSIHLFFTRSSFFHRMNGWAIVILALCGNASVVMYASYAFGGDVPVQAGTGTLVVIASLGLASAIHNVKRLQVDQHRAWMLKTCFHFGSMITMRIILVTGTLIIPAMSHHHLAMECDKLGYIVEDCLETLSSYPDCVSYYSETNPD